MSQLTFRELESFLTDIAALMKSGVPVPEGLQQLSAHLKTPQLRQLAQEAATGTARGKSLPDAIAQSAVKLPKGALALLKCADLSGDARGLLDFAAIHSRRIRAHRAAIVTAAFYPLIVLLAMVVLVWFISYMILPKFEDIFRQLGAELPFLTAAVMDFAQMLRGNLGHLILLVVIGSLVALALSERLRDRLFETLALVPGYGHLIAISDTAVVMKFLGVLLRRGIPLPTALEAVGMAVALESTRESLTRMANAASKGHPVAEHLNPLFPATATHLFDQAERHGKLPEVCESLGEWADSTFEYQGRRATGILEPVAILAIMLVVGVIVISLYLPLFSIPKLVGR